MRTVITHRGLEETSSFNKSDEKDILLSLEQARIPAFCVKKRHRKMGHRSGILLKIHRRVIKLPLPSVLLANVQSLDNKIVDLRLRYLTNRTLKTITSYVSPRDTDNIDLAGCFMYRQNREVTSGKTRGGGVFLFVNNSWCAMSNIKEVSKYFSTEV